MRDGRHRLCANGSKFGPLNAAYSHTIWSRPMHQFLDSFLICITRSNRISEFWISNYPRWDSCAVFHLLLDNNPWWSHGVAWRTSWQFHPSQTQWCAIRYRRFACPLKSLRLELQFRSHLDHLESRRLNLSGLLEWASIDTFGAHDIWRISFFCSCYCFSIWI